MLRKTVFTIFLVLFLLGCVLLLAAGTLSGRLSGNLPLSNLIGDAGLPFVFLGVGGMLMLPVMGQGVPPGAALLPGAGRGNSPHLPGEPAHSRPVAHRLVAHGVSRPVPDPRLQPGAHHPRQEPHRRQVRGEEGQEKGENPHNAPAAPFGAAFFSFVGRQRRKNVV